jgi:hypothetical protein
MNINWVNNQRKSSLKADVMITLTGKKKDHLVITFAQGCFAVKFKNSERVMVGFDEGDTCFCMAPGGSEGFKVSRPGNGNPRIQISTAHIIGHCAPHELCGNYMLKQDPTTKVCYIGIGTLTK